MGHDLSRQTFVNALASHHDALPEAWCDAMFNEFSAL
jgi:hypothetical protein